jgi:hypothetical protein
MSMDLAGISWQPRLAAPQSRPIIPAALAVLFSHIVVLLLDSSESPTFIYNSQSLRKEKKKSDILAQVARHSPTAKDQTNL